MLPLAIRDLIRYRGRALRYLLWRAVQRRTPQLHRPIFIVGCPRSGTSIAVELFGEHPDVANWSEAGRLWDPVDYSNPEADHHWGAERATRARARRLHAWCEYHRRSQGKERFVNKHPRNSVRIGFLDEIFPDAVFVHIVRDGRAVAQSMLNQIRTRPRRQRIPMGNFCKPPGWRELLRADLVEQTALQWREIVRAIRAHRAELGARFCEVRYEDFCAGTREICRDLFLFAGLPVEERHLQGIPRQLESRNDKFRRTLTPEELETINRVQAELLGELGYKL